MKRFSLLLALTISLTVVSCKMVVMNPSGKVPPGQMKKATGAKSARTYAPGQTKKGNGNVPPGQAKKR